ncbi:MAG: S26 family signal peptidase [Deltaproteobacteria bacterium]|nr:S26 family signal peptidase [Deltaproteobacteria bacterium]
MRGAFKDGDCLLVLPVSFDDLQTGDVVAFDSGGRSIAHRIVGRQAGGYITQGDANPKRDRHCITPGQLIGRVVERERGGRRSPVRVGMQGCLQGALLRLANQVFRRIVLALTMPYRLISASRLATLFWRPQITTAHFSEGKRDFTKFIHRGKTVACWFPQESRWTCRKPYDLILNPPDCIDR